MEFDDETFPEAPSPDARRWAAICHASALIGLLGNGIGFLLGPLFVWLYRKEEDAFVDEQGKEALNFQITMTLAVLALILPSIFLIGLPFLLLVLALMVVLPIVAAIRASDGRPYRYPLTIRFVK